MPDDGIMHGSHWGAFRAEVKDGRVIGVKPFEKDKDPSQILDAIPEMLYGPTRIGEPHLRKSVAEHGAGANPEGRGVEPFVPVSWEQALDVVAAELRRVKADHGNEAIFAGSYGFVSAIGPNLGQDAKETVNVAGLYVTPGLIDLHTHIYWGGTSLGVDPDQYMLQSGCTTLVDAGSAGPGNFPGFRAHIVEPSTARILAYINASYAGIFAFSASVMVGESADIRLLNPAEVVRVAKENLDIIVGVKVRVGLIASGGIGVAPLDIALEAADALGLPVMAHLDHPPPSRMEVLSRLRPGDVLTHCYRPFPAAPTHMDGRVRDEVLAAKEKGVIFDIGHGKGSFSWQVAEDMLAAGLPPDSISSDVHTLSEVGPAYDQLVTMSKFLHLGMDLGDVIAASTKAPASAINRPELGGLAVGGPGDATLLRIEDGAFPLTDSNNITIEARQRIARAGIVRDGVVLS